MLGSPPQTMVLDLTRQKVRIKQNDQVLSPVRKYIQESTEREKEFNITSITRWTAENARKYNKYIRNFENYHVLFNLMVMDRLMQDLEEYYKAIRHIRDKEETFQKCLDNIRQSQNMSPLQLSSTIGAKPRVQEPRRELDSSVAEES